MLVYIYVGQCIGTMSDEPAHSLYTVIVVGYPAPVPEIAVVRCYASERCRCGACPRAGLGRLLCACALKVYEAWSLHGIATGKQHQQKIF